AYSEAISHFTEALIASRSADGSKALRVDELAALYYSCGYARVKLSESIDGRGAETLLREAWKDFYNCTRNDPTHHKAKRALWKLRQELGIFSTPRLAETLGPWLISLPALLVFGLIQTSFFLRLPVSVEFA